MIDLAIMVEGQDGLNWPRWQHLVETIEEAGFAGLYRSDHYTNVSPPDNDSLELWVSLTWLASHTKNIEFGPLVSPVSFRNPTMTARMASAVDDLSNGRLTLGLGAGWLEREHKNYGWDLLDIPERFKRFEEALEVITQLLGSEQQIHFEGDYYHLKNAILLPRPIRQGGPPILIGGNGPKQTLPLVARYADEWSSIYLSAKEIKQKTQILNELIEQVGRDIKDVRRSVLKPFCFGKSVAEVKQKAVDQYNSTPDELRSKGYIVGNTSAFIEQLEELADAGIYRVILHWFDYDNLDGLVEFAHSVLPHMKQD